MPTTTAIDATALRSSLTNPDLTVIDGHRVAARIIEVRCRPRALGNETSAQAPDVKPDLRCQVQIDIAHLRFDGRRACPSTHECRCGERDKHKKREPHGSQQCTIRASGGAAEIEGHDSSTRRAIISVE